MANPQINVHELSSKMKSKKELYNFLLRDGQVYLAPLQSVNVYYLKQLINGNKDVSWILYYANDYAVNSTRQGLGGRRNVN